MLCVLISTNDDRQVLIRSSKYVMMLSFLYEHVGLVRHPISSKIQTLTSVLCDGLPLGRIVSESKSK